MSSAPSTTRRLLGPLVAGDTWRTTLKTYLDLVWMPLAAFAVLGLSVATVTSFFLLPVSFLLAVLAIHAVRLTAAGDRALLAEFLRIEVPQAERRPYDWRSGSWKARAARLWWWFVGHLTSAAFWRRAAYRVASLPTTAVAVVAVTVAWSVPLALLSSPLWVPRLPDGRFAAPRPVLAVGFVLVGAALLLLAPRIVAQVGRLLRWVARLLGPRRDEALERRLRTVEASRSRAVEGAEAERRRIERDLHDGAQQRLVALAMNLGMAKERYDEDPEATRALIDEAHAEAKRAMVELRDLARGLHPAVLTDRGLGPALSAVAARSAVPVALSVDVSGRLDESIEGIAYFLVSEALANVAKHSGATEARVAIGRRGDRLVIEVTDDGCGGAEPTGSGLTGLRDRVEAVDGWFHVASPPGGPTTILAELPCAS